MPAALSRHPGSASCPVPGRHRREAERLRALHDLKILDTAPELRFDRLTNLLARIFDVPAATITMVDKDRQWHKSACGVSQREGDRDTAFCAFTILAEKSLVVEDTQTDIRFEQNPLVTAPPGIRFYAGAQLRTESGLPIGTVCIIDTKPRRFSKHDEEVLNSFARLVETELFQDQDNIKDRFLARVSANLDPLLGCLTREGFASVAGTILERSSGEEPGPSLLGVRLNDLESINYRHGTNAANQILFSALGKLRAELGSYRAEFGRLNKNTFAVFIESIADVECPRLARDLARELDAATSDELPGVQPCFLVGIIENVKEFDGVDSMLAVLDHLLAKSGKSERRAVSMYADQDGDSIRRRARLRRSVSRALFNDAFHLVYQPKVDIQTLAVNGFEALLRWTDPESGNVSPLEIVSLLEELGQEHELGKWTIRRALMQVKEWRDAGLDVKPVSINLSEDELCLPDFPQLVENKLDRFGIPPQLLEFEILERSLMDELEASVRNINHLRKLGVRFSIDDFGTGYSALRMLTQVPIDTLKIDRSFIKDMVENRDSAALVHAVIDIGHDARLKCVAEGVETREQYLILRALNCDAIQGYLFSRPLTAAATAELLLSGSKFAVPLAGTAE